MAAGGANDRRGVGTLLRDFVEESAALARGEARLAKLEVAHTARAISRGVAFVALGSVFVILGSLAFVVGVILLAGDQWLPSDRYWLAALVALGLTGTAAVALARRGLAQLSSHARRPRHG